MSHENTSHTGVPKVTIHERNIKSQLKSKSVIATVYRSAHRPASNYIHSTEQPGISSD